MAVDVAVVGARPWSAALLAEILAQPQVREALGAVEVGGDPATFPHVVRVDSPRLRVDLHGPRASLAGGAARYTTELGVAAPRDDEGRCWLTGVEVVDAGEDEAALHQLFDVLGSLAASTGGFIVVDGEVVPAPGAEPPAPDLGGAVGPAPEEASGAPRAVVFAEAFVPVLAPDAEGWRRLLAVVGRMAGDHVELLPAEVEVDEGEWRGFLPTDPPPTWWPMEQQLRGRHGPHAEWRLAPAAQPHEALSQVSLSTVAGAALAADLRDGLVAVGPDYGFVHVWTPEEEVTGTVGLRLDDSPWVLLTPRHLVQALPDLYWAQVLGEPWIRAIGEDVLAGAPAHRSEPLTDARWLLQLTADPLDLPSLLDARRRCRRHLGADRFWDPVEHRAGLEGAVTLPAAT